MNRHDFLSCLVVIIFQKNAKQKFSEFQIAKKYRIQGGD